METHVLHSVSSQKLADKLIVKLVRYGVDRDQFSTDLCPISSKPGRKVTRIIYKPHWGVDQKEHMARELAGFIRGYLMASRSKG